MDPCDVIIVNFNAGKFLKAAVESVIRSPLVMQVYIVDNASTDSSIDDLLSGHNDRVTIIRSSSNLGYAASCNIGIARSTSDNVLLLNPDCQVQEGAVESLITALYSADRVGMVGPLLLNPDGSEQAGGRRPFPTPHTLLAQVLRSTRLGRYVPAFDLPSHRDPLPKEPIQVAAISGACMMVRRAAIFAVGELDTQYFLHWEDLDWCIRFHREQWKILFVPDAKVIHEKGVSSRLRPFAVQYYKHRGMVRFYRKFSSGRYSGLLIFLVTVGVWVRFSILASWHALRRVYEHI